MIKIVSISPRSTPSDTLLFKSLQNNSDLECVWVNSNKESLCKAYNSAIKSIKTPYDWLVLVHDDVIIENPESLSRKIAELGAKYDVIGVAGTREVKLKTPALWHLVSDRSHHRGAVGHLMNNKKHMTSFGPYPDRVVMIDGVFMAVKQEVFKKVMFDENNPAKFHFYDLDFSLSCHKAGFKVGVGDITITHASPGLKEFTDEWRRGEKWFLDKHNA